MEERIPSMLPDSKDIELIHKDYLFLDNSFNPRSEKPDPVLADDVRAKNGYQEPIVVFKYSNTRYGVGGGWQRVGAGIQIGYTKFPCKVFTNRHEMLDYLDSSYIQKPLSTRANINNVMIHYREYNEDINVIAEKLHKSISTIRRYIAISKYKSLMILISEPEERSTEEWRFISDIGALKIFGIKSLTLDIAESLAIGLPYISEHDMGLIATLLMKNKKSYNGKIDKIIDYIVSHPNRNDYKKLINEFMGVKKKCYVDIRLDSLTPEERELMEDYKREMRLNSDSKLLSRILKRQLLLYKNKFIGNTCFPMKEVSLKIGTQEICMRCSDDGFKIAILGDNNFYVDFRIDEILEAKYSENPLIHKSVKDILDTINVKF